MRSPISTRRLATAAGIIIIGLVSSPGSAGAHGPTCSDVEFLHVEVHGQHVVRDYVIGAARTDPGATVGSIIGGDGGAALPGGPGPAFHFAEGFAPGASFCTESSSFGRHV